MRLSEQMKTTLNVLFVNRDILKQEAAPHAESLQRGKG
jgi:hypothetical protein